MSMSNDHVTGNLINNKIMNLAKQIISIKPDIWDKPVLKSEYWKDETYHPSIFKFDRNTVKNNILLIRKVIKKKSPQNKTR